MSHQAMEWRDFTGSTTTGTVKVLHDVPSPELGNTRDLLVYLPPGHASGDRRYPVLYMHDGQNLFDAATSFAGEWEVDETLERLAGEGLEAIAVGLPNAGPARLDEYSPFVDHRHGGGKGVEYLAFVVNTVKPLIDASFRTRPGRESTGILGSSMGGLISLYAFLAHPEVFGLVGAMSPALWFARGAMLDHVRAAPYRPGRIYLDTGTREIPRRVLDWMRFRRDHRDARGPTAQLHELLQRKGWRDGVDLLYVEERGAGHDEAAWRRRLPNALRFLLRPAVPAARSSLRGE